MIGSVREDQTNDQRHRTLSPAVRTACQSIRSVGGRRASGVDSGRFAVWAARNFDPRSNGFPRYSSLLALLENVGFV